MKEQTHHVGKGADLGRLIEGKRLPADAAPKGPGIGAPFSAHPSITPPACPAAPTLVPATRYVHLHFSSGVSGWVFPATGCELPAGQSPSP